ncbi:MAG TPA: TlpA disulfide reductase family protein [Actinomycetota bacterium]|nr:TlpA disulfide reductase family protein [Actinomycetota bacterium]
MIPTDELEDQPRRGDRARIVMGLIALAAIVAIVFGVTRPAPESASPTRPTGAAPEFSLELLDGSGRLTSGELRGHPVVLNFWASWCAPCREEAGLLEDRWRRYADEGVIFVGVNIRDTPTAARAFVNEFDVTYPVVRDPEQTLVEQVGLVGLPQTFFITADWTFHSSASGAEIGTSNGTEVLGAIDADDLDRAIRALLATS